MTETIILVRGCGDVASAVAHTLFVANYSVVIHDLDCPTATRRKMAYCDAVFDGQAVLNGIWARLTNDISEIAAQLPVHGWIPITTLNFALLLGDLRPDVLVDARMKKHDPPEIQISLAPLTIGLGPNFVGGETVHAGVETGWNQALGQVIWKGATRPLEGEPQTIAGHARDRYVYAPAAGVFRSTCGVGEMVSMGQIVAYVDQIPLRAPITGALRGVTRDSVPVAKNTKVIEVDPRGEQAPICGISERPKRIADGVLAAIKMWENQWFLFAAPWSMLLYFALQRIRGA